MKILVGSKNPVKIEAVQEAFSMFYGKVETKGLSVLSDVPEMPIGEDTKNGAENRARTLLELNSKNNLNADFFVGIEGGIAKFFDEWFSFGMMCILDKKGNKGFGSSPHFQLPPNVIRELLKGIELGIVMDEISNTHNSKQKFGAIGYFTNGIMDRKDLYVSGLIAALAPFQHKDLYFI